MTKYEVRTLCTKCPFLDLHYIKEDFKAHSFCRKVNDFHFNIPICPVRAEYNKNRYNK